MNEEKELKTVLEKNSIMLNKVLTFKPRNHIFMEKLVIIISHRSVISERMLMR